MVRLPLRIAAVLMLFIIASALFYAFGIPTVFGTGAASEAPVSNSQKTDRITVTGDLDSDGILETYQLKDHRLTVTADDQELWSSPADYSIDSFVLGDIDNDGSPNLVFSLWKKGCFGKSRPFWHTGNDDSYKNHLFVYKLQDHIFKAVWCSSDLDNPILSVKIRDVNNDGENELVTVEGDYKKIAGNRFAADPDGEKQTTIWKWSGWGFQQ